MRFWDSSAVLPLVVREATSPTVAKLLQEDGAMTTWWGTWIECLVGLSQLRREGMLNERTEEEARARLERLSGDWSEIRPTDDLRLLATLLSSQHPLKAADTLQLAAALRWCEGDTRAKGFVCLDERLRRSTFEEGFDVLPKDEEA